VMSVLSRDSEILHRFHTISFWAGYCELTVGSIQLSCPQVFMQPISSQPREDVAIDR